MKVHAQTETGNNGEFEPGLSRLRVRLPTELPRSTNCGRECSSPPTSRNGNELSDDNMWSLIASGPSDGDNMNGDNCGQNGDNKSLYLHGMKTWLRN